MKIWNLLAKPRRASYRTFAMVFGVLILVLGATFGIEQSFANWPGLAFLACLGITLFVAGIVLSEAQLQRIAYAFLWVNVALAILGFCVSWFKSAA